MKGILRVHRSKRQARRAYDRLSRFYDYFAAIFEGKSRDVALGRLGIAEGEKVLEIGFGTGHCLVRIAEAVGVKGRAYGIDLSPGMIEAARRRLQKKGLQRGPWLCCGDAETLPFKDRILDAVFMSFVLELFDTHEIPRVLREVRRVLKPGGRLGVVSMSKDGGGLALRLYEWAHKKFPVYVDCRPIYVAQAIEEAGFGIRYREKITLLGLPGEIVVAEAPAR